MQLFYVKKLLTLWREKSTYNSYVPQPTKSTSILKITFSINKPKTSPFPIQDAHVSCVWKVQQFLASYDGTELGGGGCVP